MADALSRREGHFGEISELKAGLTAVSEFIPQWVHDMF